jgi:hypothetical protein
MTTDEMLTWLRGRGPLTNCIADRLDKQEAEIVRMRPVVEATQAWRRDEDKGAPELYNAIDAYERALPPATIAATAICERFGLGIAAVEGVAEEIERVMGEGKV